jgi:hypothetical protein
MSASNGVRFLQTKALDCAALLVSSGFPIVETACDGEVVEFRFAPDPQAREIIESYREHRDIGLFVRQYSAARREVQRLLYQALNSERHRLADIGRQAEHHNEQHLAKT